MRARRIFEEYYREHYEKVLRFVIRRLSDREHAIEVCADTFLTVWSKFDGADPPSVAWLYQTARNHIGNAYQSRQREQQLYEKLRTQAAIRVASIETTVVADAMDELSDNDREALRLTYWEGLSAAEVAVVLECSEQAAWKRISRARLALRSALLETTTRRQGGAR